MRSEETSSRETTWRSRMVRFHSSGLTVAAFCRREGVSVPSFYHWRKRLGRGQQPSDRGSADGPPTTRQPHGFVAVNVSAAMVAEVEFPNGVRIRVPATNAEALRAAVLAGNDVCQGVSSC